MIIYHNYYRTVNYVNIGKAKTCELWLTPSRAVCTKIYEIITNKNISLKL